ncbi:MAG TPA: hypothetical protein DDW52_20105 [Planctomycetaceae bacterium]|nr:hypothetical protein [Planctomycetaceae bacterium]
MAILLRIISRDRAKAAGTSGSSANNCACDLMSYPGCGSNLPVLRKNFLGAGITLCFLTQKWHEMLVNVCKQTVAFVQI